MFIKSFSISLICALFSQTVSAQTTLLSEQFSGTQPAGWINSAGTGTTGNIWLFNNPKSRVITGANFNANFAILDSDHYGNGNTQDATLVTPGFNASSFVSVILSFDEQFRQYTGTFGYVDVSTDGGSTWTTVLTRNPYDVGYPNPAVPTTIDISNIAAFKPSVNVRWHFTGSYGFWWAIDDVLITGNSTDNTAPSITNITVAPNSCTASSQTISSTIIDNSGTVLNPNLNYSSDGGSTYTSIAMSASGSTYTATIPLISGSVKYYISATDAAANNASSVINYYSSGTVSAFPYSVDFENTNAAYIGLTSGSESNIAIDAAAGNASNYGLVLEGSSATGFVTPIASNVWTTNSTHFSKASFCLDLTSVGSATLNFDLKQGYYLDNFNTNLRLTINGVQVGSDYRPSGATTTWATQSINLTSYVGSVITVAFESSVKYSRAQGFSSYNFLDNITVGSGDITAPVISSITQAANNCTTTTRVISANITDNTSVVTKQVKFTNNFGATWFNGNMVLSSGTTYTATIPAISGTILYYILAIDPAGNARTSATYSYTNGAVYLPATENFETGNAPYFSFIKNAESNVVIDPAAGHASSKGLILEGKTLTNWTGANWSPTSDHFSSAKLCVDLSSSTMATLKFNLFQGYQYDSTFTNLRVTVNGTAISPIYRPSMYPSWETITLDLSPYTGSVVTIAFESSVKFNHLNGYTTYNYIDNIQITDADIIPPVISAISQVSDNCIASVQTVTATITDNDGAGSTALINYSNNNGTSWSSVAMPVTSGTTYSGNIPAVSGTIIYRIISTDPSTNTDTSQTKSYNSGAVSFPYSQDFETGTAPFWSFISNSKSIAYIDSLAANSSLKGVVMSGTGVAGFVTPTSSNVWTTNSQFLAVSKFCIDLSATTTAFLNFDLQQGYYSNNYFTNLRVTVNGSPVGYDIRPYNGTAGWKTYTFNLSSFVGGIATIAFESSAKYSYSPDSTFQTYNFIDNVNVSATSTNTDQTPPAITGITAPTNNCTASSRLITAAITDATGTVSQVLKYSSDGGATWTSVVMVNIVNTSNYTATIPSISGSVKYYIESYDPAGNRGVSPVYYYASGTAAFPYSTDLETNNAPFIGFTTNSESNAFIDSLAGNSSNYGITLEGNTATNFVMPTSSNVWSVNPEHFARASFCTDLTGVASAILKFDLKQGYYQDDFNTNLRVTVNGAPVGNDYRPSGATTNWINQTLDLSAYVGSVVTVAFESSVQYSRAQGFQTYNYIDNINITLSTSVIEESKLSEIQVYPNPTTGIVNLNYKSDQHQKPVISIYNSMGKIINVDVNHLLQNKDYIQLDLTEQPSGLYYIVFKTEGKITTKKVTLIK